MRPFAPGRGEPEQSCLRTLDPPRPTYGRRPIDFILFQPGGTVRAGLITDMGDGRHEIMVADFLTYRNPIPGLGERTGAACTFDSGGIKVFI